jgi:hypothetical protein
VFPALLQLVVPIEIRCINKMGTFALDTTSTSEAEGPGSNPAKVFSLAENVV